jgi:hypothetical protein
LNRHRPAEVITAETVEELDPLIFRDDARFHDTPLFRTPTALFDFGSVTGRPRHVLYQLSGLMLRGATGDVCLRHDPAEPASLINDEHAPDLRFLHLG